MLFPLEGVKSPPPPNAHIHPEETPSADYLQSIVIETKDGAVVEIYNSPNSYGGVKKWGWVGVGRLTLSLEQQAGDSPAQASSRRR